MGSNDRLLAPIGKAMKGRREKIIIQTHFGVVYPGGIYERNRKVDLAKAETERQLKLLGTDYSDIGLVSNLDEDGDYEKVMAPGGLWDYMLELKRQGVVRHLGLSSHRAEMCNRMLDTGEVDMIMFSENPIYDFSLDSGEMMFDEERAKLYRRCVKENVGITVMKPFGGGKLLNKDTSPFGKAFTTYQCFKYALDRPAVVACLPGVSSLEFMKNVVSYYEASDEELDYSFLGKMHMSGITNDNCIYCGHCQPCSADIDISLINKYYDLSLVGDELAVEHYKNLAHKASDCIECGLCTERCPFKVNTEARVKKIAEYFVE